MKRVGCLAIGALIALGGCSPEGVSVQGRAVDDIYRVFGYLATGVFVLVASLILWSIVRYRERPDDDSEPDQFAHNRKLEILWFAIPQLLVVGLFVATVVTNDEVTTKDPNPAVVIDVQGFQWGWSFDYRDEGIHVVSTSEDPGEIAVPIDRPVAFFLTSNDVVHSFWVPRFNLKRDVIPGRTQRVDQTVTEAGTYRAVCAEFCGLLHDKMVFSVEALTAADYDDWVRAKQGAGDGND